MATEGQPRRGCPLAIPRPNRCAVTVMEDGVTPRTFATETEAVTGDGHLEVRLLPYGGFVAVLTPTV